MRILSETFDEILGKPNMPIVILPSKVNIKRSVKLVKKMSILNDIINCNDTGAIKKKNSFDKKEIGELLKSDWMESISIQF